MTTPKTPRLTKLEARVRNARLKRPDAEASEEVSTGQSVLAAPTVPEHPEITAMFEHLESDPTPVPPHVPEGRLLTDEQTSDIMNPLAKAKVPIQDAMRELNAAQDAQTAADFAGCEP